MNSKKFFIGTAIFAAGAAFAWLIDRCVCGRCILAEYEDDDLNGILDDDSEPCDCKDCCCKTAEDEGEAIPGTNDSESVSAEKDTLV